MSALAEITPQIADAQPRAKTRVLSPQAREALRRARRHFAPPRRMTVSEWAQTHRRMHSGPLAGGLFSLSATPVLRGILEAYTDPAIAEIWCQKSAQIGWTQGFVMNVMGYHIHLDPCPIMVLFAKDGAGKRFMREKLEPAIRATRVLFDRIPLHARSAANTQDYKRFPGGFIQLAGSGSPGNVKSTDFRVIIVEEPDDTTQNVRGQGDTIALARERKKSYSNGKMVVGGTPTVKDRSKVAAGMLKTDQRRYFVGCPHCQHEQSLKWENVRWLSDSATHHPVYGTHRPETAAYSCDECGVLWTEEERHQAIRAAAERPDRGWRATAPFNRLAGFFVSELYSLFSESRLPLLARKFIESKHALDQGDDTLMRSFINNQLGETWEIKSDAPEVAELAERALDYAERHAPAEALIATCFVDVQRGGEVSGEPRLEYLIVGWGRGEESWRIARGRVFGNPLEESTWVELDRELARPIRSAGGGHLHISQIGVDSGDGMTQDAVLRYVRAKRQQGRDVIPTKGASKRGRPIFSPPKAQDHDSADRASKYGLKLYLIGTDTAKDTIAGRLKLTGRGPSRMHWPACIGHDYYEQITAEVKVPGRSGEDVWEKKAGRANEMLDCEVGNLHLAKRMRLHQFHESHWIQLETRMRQPDLAHLPKSDPSAVLPFRNDPRPPPPRRHPPDRSSRDFSI